MRYVYACKIKSHPRKEVEHSVKVDPVIQCEACGRTMYRVIQHPLAINFSAPLEILTDWMTTNYWRRRQGLPLFSPNDANRPDKPLPGKLVNRPMRGKRNGNNQTSSRTN